MATTNELLGTPPPAAGASSAATADSATGVDPSTIDRRTVAIWDAVGGVVIFFAGSFLHFLYELSGFAIIAAPFGSVNESTWEHLKLFFWPGLAFAVVQHAYLRHRVNNFWAAKAASLALVSVGVAVLFYTYVGIVLPIYGKGILLGTLVTGAVGVAVGQFASYRLLTGAQRSPRARRVGIVGIVLMALMFVAFTFAPPRLFLFENFFGYAYDGQFGILADYTPYLVFK
jgi:hypothetical protein